MAVIGSPKPLRRYRFTWAEVLSALQRRMHDADHAAGVSLLSNADHTASIKPLFHRIRAGDALEVDIFEEPPRPEPEPVLSLVLKRAPRLGKEPP
jgi:hypothetical protein